MSAGFEPGGRSPVLLRPPLGSGRLAAGGFPGVTCRAGDIRPEFSTCREVVFGQLLLLSL